MRRGAFAAGLVAFLLVGFGTVLFQEGAGQDKKSPKEPWIEEIESVFVRSEVCRQCHDRHYQEMAGLRTKQRALQVTELAGFPPPALRTRAGRLWVRAAVEAFLGDWPRRRGRPPGKGSTTASSDDTGST